MKKIMKDLKYGGNMYLKVVYDIKQEGNYSKRQRFVFKTCKKYLRHIQNSVSVSYTHLFLLVKKNLHSNMVRL